LSGFLSHALKIYMHRREITIGRRKIGGAYAPFVIAEIGINHEGSMAKAKQMVQDAHRVGAECVKFQSHVVEDEMTSAAKKVIPSHTTESIWDIMARCAFNEKQEKELKAYTEKLGMIYLSTPFSRAAADRLERMKVKAYKIGSGECNNYPLIEHIASFKKPVILSTGMNDIPSVRKAVAIFRKHKTPYALMNCTSMYPTPYGKVRLGAVAHLKKSFPDAVVGQSDHSVENEGSVVPRHILAFPLHFPVQCEHHFLPNAMPFSSADRALGDVTDCIYPESFEVF